MVLAVVAVAILSMTASASASALNLTGTWQANYHCETGSCAGQNFPAKDVLTQAEGSEEVTGSNEGESISGTLTGNTFKFQSKAGAYSTEATLTISADGNSWSGPLHDSHGTSGTYTATRRRVAAIQVNCTAFHPGLPNEYFECTAQLGDASGQSPVQIPTGTVAFAVNPGGGGSIYGPKSCTLAASQSGGASSFCAVDYLPPAVGIPLGSEPPLTATYSGDSAFAMTSGQPKNSISSGNPLTPRSVYESLCQDIFTPACEGVVPPPALFSDVCFSLTGCGAGEHGSGSGEETVDISPDEHSLVADVSCPAPSGQLTSCELQAYLEGMDLDPTVKAKLEYELNYAEYLKQLAIERAGIVSETQKFVAALPVEGTPAEQKEAEERHNKVSAQITDQINGLYDALAKRGTPIPPGFEPVDTAAVSKFCESSASQKDCLAFWAAIGEVLKASSDKLSSTKATLGVNVPFKPPAKAQSSSISTVIFDKATKRGPHKMVFATSKNVTVPAGKKAKVKLSLPPFVRARLKDALGNGVRTVKADMVVQIATSAGDSTLRTVPVKLKLVAKKKHH